MTRRHAGIGRDHLKHLTDRPYPRPLIKQLTMLILTHIAKLSIIAWWTCAFEVVLAFDWLAGSSVHARVKLTGELRRENVVKIVFNLGLKACYPVLPLVPQWFSVLTCINLCYPLFPCVTPCSPVLTCVTPCSPVLPCVTPCSPVLPCVTPCSPVVLCVNLCYPLFPCVTLCYPLFPCVTLCYPLFPSGSLC